MNNNICVSPIRQFVRDNVSEFCRTQHGRFNLVGNNGNYLGEYFISRNPYVLGNHTSLSNLRVVGDDSRPIMQETVWTRRKNVNIEDFSAPLKAVTRPKLITQITTMLDFVNDKFKTVRSVIELKNYLVRIDKDDLYFNYNENFEIFKPLKDKLQYEVMTETIRTGKISEVKKIQNPHKESNRYPYIFW